MRRAIGDSFRKLDPRHQVRNPVMFVVEVGSVMTTGLFIQAVVGLYDYTQITKDPRGLALFEAGDAEARVDTPQYNTGAWSLYDQGRESDLSYHELLTQFLTNLCQRTQQSPKPVLLAQARGAATHASTPVRA